MLSRRVRRNLDWVLIAAAMGIACFGLVAIASATRSAAGIPDPLYYVKKQLLWLGLGLGEVVVILLIDYLSFARLARLIYFGNLCLLGAVLVAGFSALGAQRWISIGPFELQPSEFAKIAIIITLASMLRGRDGKLGSWIGLAPPLLHVALPMLLILRQPDLGTSLVFLAVLFGQLYVAGAPTRKLAMALTSGLGAAAAAVFLHLRYGFPIPLKEYQLKRLLVFLDPQADPLRAGYHVIQSTIAIGSGRLLGKGLFAGTQSQLNFLPEQRTDFIFSVVGEELGFVGAVALLALYLVLIWRGIRVITQAKDAFGALVAAGVTTMFTFHVLVNVGMAAGIMPVTGIPLPLVSYGGSSMLASWMGIGLLLNVHLRRHKILF
jgi:rod shape determining protein RodA